MVYNVLYPQFYPHYTLVPFSGTGQTPLGHTVKSEGLESAPPVLTQARVRR